MKNKAHRLCTQHTSNFTLLNTLVEKKKKPIQIRRIKMTAKHNFVENQVSTGDFITREVQ
jgi:hypothetical protein